MAGQSPSNMTYPRETPCCRVESIVTVDERGQMVLPKEVREKAGIRPGEKFALVLMEKDGQVCCMALLRTQALSDMVREFLRPVVEES